MTGEDMDGNTEVATRVQNDVGIMAISGEVTSFSEQSLETGYEELSSHQLMKICINFEQVSYINSAGMAIIIGILTKARKREQTLLCCGLTDHFQKIFGMVGISKYMPHYDSEEAALENA